MAQRSNREQLVKGAMKCLRTKGYARTTARDIAAASNANLASIGYHFGSKEALLNEAMIRTFKRRNWRVGETARSTPDTPPLDRLRALFVAAGEVFHAPRPLFVAFVEAIAEADHSETLRTQMAEHYREARRDVAETFRTILGGSSDAGDGNAEVMASILMALFDGLVLQWLLDPDEIPTGEELIDALVGTIGRVIASNGRSGPPARSPRRSRRPTPKGRSSNTRRAGGADA